MLATTRHVVALTIAPDRSYVNLTYWIYMFRCLLPEDHAIVRETARDVGRIVMQQVQECCPTRYDVYWSRAKCAAINWRNYEREAQQATQHPKRAAAPPPSRPAAATNKIAKMGTATAATSDPPMATWVSLLAPAVQEVFGREQVYALAQTAGKLPFL